MSLFGRLEKRVLASAPWTGQAPDRIPRNSEIGASIAGVRVDQDSALSHIPVFSCVSLISDVVSTFPVHAFWSGVDNKGRPMSTRLTTQPLILTNPSPTAGNAIEVRQQVMNSLLLGGNTLNEIAAVGSNGVPTIMSPISSKLLRRPVYRDAAGRRLYDLADGRTLIHWADLSPGQRREGSSMMHWRGFVRAGDDTGLSPIAAGRQGIGLSMAAEEFGARWFGDGAIPGSVLSSPDELADDEALDIQQKWVDAHYRRRVPAVLSGGLTWEQVNLNADESQFIESRKLSALDIAQLYRIPPHMVGIVDRNTSWGTGIEEQGLGFVVHTLGPWIARYEAALNSLLPPGYFVKFNFSGLLRGRTLDRFRAYAIARSWGWFSANDIRSLEDLPPLDEGGDTYLQPLNMVDAAAALDMLKDNPVPAGPS